MNSMCSTKCATPLLRAVSHLEPASIHRPTVAVCEPLSSVATRMPFSNVVTFVSGTFTWAEHDGAADLQRLDACAETTEWSRNVERVVKDVCRGGWVTLTWPTPEFRASAFRGDWTANRREAIAAHWKRRGADDKRLGESVRAPNGHDGGVG